MELEEQETIVMNSEVNRPFALSWSDDDRVLLIVENGVQVLKLVPSSTNGLLQLTFRRSFIPVSPSLPLQNQAVENKSNFYLWSQKRKNMYLMTLNPDMSCNVDKMNSPTYCIKEARCRTLQNSISYAGLLTNQGSLDIYEWRHRKWRPVADISEQWIEMHKEQYACNMNPSFDELIGRLAEMKISAFCWPSEYLITGHNDGSISFWELDSQREDVVVHFKTKLRSLRKLVCIECLMVMDMMLLVVGNMDGNIQALLINDMIQVVHEETLWNENDSIRPGKICVHIHEGQIRVLVGKRHLLLSHKLSAVDSTLSNITTKYHEFPHPMASLDGNVAGKIVVSLTNHAIYSLSDDLVPEQLTMRAREKQDQQFTCCGVAISKNRSVWMVISSPKVYYDTRVIKDVTQLIVYVTKVKSFGELTDASSSALVEKIVASGPNIRLTDISDVLEQKRIDFLSGQVNFKDSFTLKSDNKVLEAKLYLWEAKWKQRFFAEDGRELPVVADLERYIMKEHAGRWLTMLGDSDLDNTSRRIMKLFLNEVKSSEVVVDSDCLVCGLPVALTSCRFARCSQGHCLPRCCLSLLPCGITQVSTCQCCQAVALSQYVTSFGAVCTFCDSSLDEEIKFQGSQPSVGELQLYEVKLGLR